MSHKLVSLYIGDGEYYTRTDADKVIAELKETLNNSRNARKYWRKEYLIEYKECSYQKYKRCLAMAKWCDEAYNRECGLNPEEMTNTEFYKQLTEFWPRWSSRWLKIAEKFKPNSTAQQGKGKQMELVETKHDLLTTKYTKVLEESDYKYNAPHTFKVVKAQEETSGEHKGENLVLSEIHFQEGPIKECGVNGVCNEDLLVMVIRRLEGFQNSEFRCRENALALTHIEEALLWLRKRTMSREARGVEGTHKV